MVYYSLGESLGNSYVEGVCRQASLTVWNPKKILTVAHMR